MRDEPGLVQSAELFKVLGNSSRLWLLKPLSGGPRSVGPLAEVAGISQPLVSQHLRSRRQMGSVASTRRSKEIIYRSADLRISHTVNDAIAHVQETEADGHHTHEEGTYHG